MQTIICPYLLQEKPTSFLTACMYSFFCVCFQLEEIKNIGSLPCLEKLNLSSNPMCIIPDYRTKVLAQFGDRAAEVRWQNQHTVNVKALLPLMPLRRGTLPTVPNALHFCNVTITSTANFILRLVLLPIVDSLHHQVCLDSKLTTEKELDTVEVLKAIQKAKEVKDRKSGSNKKVHSVTLSWEAAPGGSSLCDNVVQILVHNCSAWIIKVSKIADIRDWSAFIKMCRLQSSEWQIRVWPFRACKSSTYAQDAAQILFYIYRLFSHEVLLIFLPRVKCWQI